MKNLKTAKEVLIELFEYKTERVLGHCPRVHGLKDYFGKCLNTNCNKCWLSAIKDLR